MDNYSKKSVILPKSISAELTDTEGAYSLPISVLLVNIELVFVSISLMTVNAGELTVNASLVGGVFKISTGNGVIRIPSCIVSSMSPRTLHFWLMGNRLKRANQFSRYCSMIKENGTVEGVFIFFRTALHKKCGDQ